MTDMLIRGLDALSLPTDAAPALARYGSLLLEKNKTMNLTAITDPEQVAQLHMLDSAAILGCAHFQGKRVLDVGTGAGFPGMVLKLTGHFSPHRPPRQSGGIRSYAPIPGAV